jgi:hypothetical protein
VKAILQRTNNPLLRSTRFFILLSLLFLSFYSFGQHAIVIGVVKDTGGVPLSEIRVKVIGGRETTVTGSDGKFSLQVPSGKDLEIEFTYLATVEKRMHVKALTPKETYDMQTVVLKGNFGMNDIVITDSSRKINRYMEVINPHNFDDIPNPGGGFEGILKMLAGVSSNNELSSQYSVRGGNYDENLVYINDIEVYRPQLVRSGQEEGLSIINTDMVQSLQFSAGGFEARYGDKLSSVLDIKYKDPDSFALKTNLSLLGAFVEAEGTSVDHRLRYIAGVRYRSSKYLLNSLDVQGDYQPTFLDAQAYLTYDLTDRLRIGYLGYYGSNEYLSVPQSQTTQFGTASSAAQFVVAFDGQQILQYNTFLNGLTLDFHPNKRNTIKFINSFYFTTESEDYDLLGAYKLQELNNNLGSAGFGSANYTFGLGEFLYHARNSFYSEIYNSEIKGVHTLFNAIDLQWGLKYQHEHVEASLNEYHYLDSVDYSVSHVPSTGNQLNVYSYLYSRQNNDWNRYSGYVQGTYNLMPKYNSYLTVGVRSNYWDFTKELLISPRAQVTYEPNADYNRRIIIGGFDDSLQRKNIRLKASAGLYQQPAFFKELFNPDGTIAQGIRAQKSSHFVVGSDVTFKMWNRPFKWTTELYYKYMWDLIPYQIDNVHIVYLGKNDAKGYATGVDFQLNGELVKDAPSWVSLSLLDTRENLTDDSYIKTDYKTGKQSRIYPGYIPRPTDQRVRFSLFFQDYIPKNPTYKVHLNLVFGSGLPFGPPTLNRYQDTLRLPPYRRVDIGFSKQFWDKNKQRSKSRVLNSFRSIWFSIEVFNLLQIDNTVAYLWIQDISGNQWAVPSYLTSRRLNFHLELKF